MKESVEITVKTETAKVRNLGNLLAEMDSALAAVTENMQDVTGDPDFLMEKLKVDFLHEVGVIMERESITSAELARRMGVSRARVTKVLNDTDNFQMGTMARISAALNCGMELRLVPRTLTAEWDAPGGDPRQAKFETPIKKSRRPTTQKPKA